MTHASAESVMALRAVTAMLTAYHGTCVVSSKHEVVCPRIPLSDLGEDLNVFTRVW